MLSIAALIKGAEEDARAFRELGMGLPVGDEGGVLRRRRYTDEFARLRLSEMKEPLYSTWFLVYHTAFMRKWESLRPRTAEEQGCTTATDTTMDLG